MDGSKFSKIEASRMAVRLAHLDRLLDLTGEVIIASNNLNLIQRKIAEFSDHRQPLSKDVLEEVKVSSITSDRISADLHHLVMEIRMVEIKETFLSFRRLARELSKQKDKKVALEIVGEDTLVDKSIAEHLNEVLTHQIRNAIDHGIESPLERKQKGKDPTGVLTLKAYNKEKFTFIQIIDDGRGIDVEKVKKKAVEKMLLSEEEARSMEKQKALDFIFFPGFSTAAQSTETSGRGVGMDVVKECIGNLGGEVFIETEEGKGTSFTYKIPEIAAVNITDALVVRINELYIAVPIANVATTLGITRNEIQTTMRQGENILYLGKIIPLYDLMQLLYGRKVEITGGAIPVIIIEYKNSKIALKVSEFLSPQKLVIIPLDNYFSLQGISGVSVLSGNRFSYILDIQEIINLSRGYRKGYEAMEKKGAAIKAAQGIEEKPAAEKVKTTEKGPSARPAADQAQQAQAVSADHLDVFFEEIKSMVKDLDKVLLDLEADPKNSGLINSTFRSFHSLKGNLLMIGQKALGDYIHEVESVIEGMREGKVEINEDSIDILLDAVKCVESNYGSIRAGKPIEEISPKARESLEKFKAPAETAQVEMDLGDLKEKTFAMDHLARFSFYSEISKGSVPYQILLNFSSDYQEPFLVAYLILKQLSRIGIIHSTLPTMEEIEEGLVLDTMKILLTTSHSVEKISRYVTERLRNYYDVTGFEYIKVEE
ncbi:MAG: chemotaxis protein CheW [Nitrospinae bacterium]|nr:chemotaxis protein CheW [Nitrospinota bacterium]